MQTINEDFSACLNKPGYSQHLVATSILLMRMRGEPDPLVNSAAKTLAEKEPRNAFFVYLNEGPTDRVKNLVLEKCPTPAKLPVPPLHQWQWEREEADKAWEHSAYWDCIFMANLVRLNP